MSASAWFVLGLGLVLALPIGWRVLMRRFDPFEPIVVFVVAYGVVFVLRPAWMLVHGQLIYFDVNIRGTFPLTLLLALVGGVAFVVGYELRVGKAIARALPTPREVNTRGAVFAAAIMTGVALVAVLVMVWPAGGFSRFTVLLEGKSSETQRLIEANGGYPFSAATLIIPAALILLAFAARHRRPLIIAAASMTFGLALLLMIPIGARANLLPLLGGALVFAYVSRGIRPRPTALAAFAVFALLASYTLTVVRNPNQRAHLGPTLRHLAQRPDTAVRFLIHGQDAEMAPVLAAGLRVVPSQLHYRYGGVIFGDLVTRPIPRQWWAGKPKPVEEQIVGAAFPDLLRYHFNPAFSPLLYLYWDFGIGGVLVGMALFGIGCRTLYEWFIRHSGTLIAQVIFAASLWYVVIGVRNDPVDTIVFASFVVLPLILLERWAALLRPNARPLFARESASRR